MYDHTVFAAGTEAGGTVSICEVSALMVFFFGLQKTAAPIPNVIIKVRAKKLSPMAYSSAVIFQFPLFVKTACVCPGMDTVFSCIAGKVKQSVLCVRMTGAPLRSGRRTDPPGQAELFSE